MGRLGKDGARKPPRFGRPQTHPTPTPDDPPQQNLPSIAGGEPCRPPRPPLSCALPHDAGANRMEPRKLGTPRQIKITPRPNKSQFRFLLLFPETARREPIEFEMPAGGARTLMRGVQHLRALHNIPIPP